MSGLTSWARKKPTLRTYFSKSEQFKKDSIGEILDNSLKILSVHSS